MPVLLDPPHPPEGAQTPYERELYRWAQRLIAHLREYSESNDQSLFRGYVVTNLGTTFTRSLDASAATLADLRAVLGSLIEDHRRGGR